MYSGSCNFLRSLPFAAFAALIISSGATQAQTPLPADKVLVSNSRTSITYAEFEAELSRIPAHEQFEFLLDKVRVAQLVENVLINKTLAIEARQQKLDQLPRAQAEIQVQTDRVLARYRGQQIQDETPKIDYLAAAREIYLANPEKTTIGERHDIWHVLVSTKGRTLEQAKSRAEDIRKRLLAGESRESLAQTLSDDSTAPQNKGDLGMLELTKLDPRFADVTRKLKIGEVSMPFETNYGFHVVKLLGHLPAKRFSFDEAKRDLIEEAKAQHQRAVWSEYLRRIQNDPKLFIDAEALDAIRPKLPEIPKLPVDAPAPGTAKAGTK
jgi:peptidyl-prolyl cis-trans isomerase C